MIRKHENEKRETVIGQLNSETRLQIEIDTQTNNTQKTSKYVDLT